MEGPQGRGSGGGQRAGRIDPKCSRGEPNVIGAVIAAATGIGEIAIAPVVSDVEIRVAEGGRNESDAVVAVVVFTVVAAIDIGIVVVTDDAVVAAAKLQARTSRRKAVVLATNWGQGGCGTSTPSTTTAATASNCRWQRRRVRSQRIFDQLLGLRTIRRYRNCWMRLN